MGATKHDALQHVWGPFLAEWPLGARALAVGAMLMPLCAAHWTAHATKCTCVRERQAWLLGRERENRANAQGSLLTCLDLLDCHAGRLVLRVLVLQPLHRKVLGVLYQQSRPERGHVRDRGCRWSSVGVQVRCAPSAAGARRNAAGWPDTGRRAASGRMAASPWGVRRGLAALSHLNRLAVDFCRHRCSLRGARIQAATELHGAEHSIS